MKNLLRITTAFILMMRATAMHAPENPDEAAKWYAKIDLGIEKWSRENDPNLKIENLGDYVFKLGKKFDANTDSRWLQAYQKAQTALLAIPGHAEYYRDRINNARAQVEEAKKGTSVSDIAHYRGLLSNEVRYGFPTLSHLPSIETVGVLGEFLFDERGYIRLPPIPTLLEMDKAVADSPVFRRAAKSLTALPIENKPVPADAQFFTPEDVLPWRHWYEEIKSGKRTFRFEGDPTEYDLSGPAPKQKLDRIALDRKRDAERAAGHSKTTGSSSVATDSDTGNPPKTVPIATIIAGLVLLGAVVWYFARERKRWGS